MLFDCVLKHVPGRTHLAADALSRRPLGEGEVIEDDDVEWVDNIALHVTAPGSFVRSATLKSSLQRSAPYNFHCLPSYYFIATICLDKNLEDIFRFLSTLEAPAFDSVQEQRRFIQKETQYFVKGHKMWKRRKNRSPLLVILDHERRMEILTQTHENLGHRGEQSVFETVRERYYWPHLRQDVRHHVRSCHQCQI
jgi:Integrase zinc binding domain